MKIHVDVDEVFQEAVQWIINNGPRIIFAFVILFGGFWIIKIIKKWLISVLRKKDVHSSLAPFIQSLVIAALHITLLLLVMQIMGIQMTLFAAGLASFGVAIGLALSGTLQNFAGGVLILLLKPFKLGDNIVAQGQDGIVESIQIFFTVITTLDNKTVVIPNSKLSNEIIVNLSQQGQRRLDLLMKFPYTSDINNIEGVINHAIQDSQDILPDPKPNIGVSSLDIDGYVIIVELWVNAMSYYQVKNAVQQRILQHLKEAAVK
ncbi:mechanosensitive ion channel family protein [Cytophaga aurantiaca]|uniref:mechanosensitive ion channel family protein n=1 Tax=Cytophaga aurantiaca TaxID=29530 RepID=UPI000377DBB8|nr:mechanosensitive ion channel family protein [Cytophaga aurantiaca]